MNTNEDYNKSIKILEGKIGEIKKKKDKLLELAINGFLENEEFAKRNNLLNEEMKKYQENITLIEAQRDNIKDMKKNIEELSLEISNELDFEENIDEYIAAQPKERQRYLTLVRNVVSEADSKNAVVE